MPSIIPKEIDYTDNNSMTLCNDKSLLSLLQSSMKSCPVNTNFSHTTDSKPCKETLPSDSRKTSAKRFLLSIKKTFCKSKNEDRKPSNLFSSLAKQKKGLIEQTYGPFVEEQRSGSGGSVRIACRSDGVKHAIKTHREASKEEPKKKYIQWLNNEITVATSLKHPFIIQTHEVLRENGKIHSVMEYCPYDLYQFVEEKKVDEDLAASYFVQLVHAIDHMHSLGIAHRDIKLENICIAKDGSIRLIDFGCAFVFRSSSSPEQKARLATTICGSEAYIAPEPHSKSPYDPRKSDVWSIAIVYLAMILRSFPWSMAKCFDYEYKMFLKYRSNPRYFNRIPKPAVPIIQRMLDPNPNTRASIEDVLNDPWVKSITLRKNSL